MERIDKLELMVNRLSRRQVKKQQAILTPYPISNCVSGTEIKGDILKYMFSCRGVITKCGLSLSQKPKQGAVLVITIANEIGSNSKSYNITRKDFRIEPGLEVFDWDRLTASFYAINPEEDIFTDVWISILWTPVIQDAHIKNFLIDELEKDALQE